jgi:hypothetical protein
MESINEVISFPLLFGIHDNCNELIKKLEKKNYELINIKKKIDNLLNVLGINNIDSIYSFIVNKINSLLQENIEKDKIIQEYKEQEEKDNNILSLWGFNSLDELNNFINKYKHHKCIDESNIDDIIIDYNLSIHDKKYIYDVYSDYIIYNSKNNINHMLNNNEKIMDSNKINNYLEKQNDDKKSYSNNEYILKKNKNISLEDIINKLNTNNSKSNFTEDINIENINKKSSSTENPDKICVLSFNNDNIKISKEKKKRGPYIKGNQEILINKIVNKIFNQKINKNLLTDIKEINRNTMNFYIKVYNEYENKSLTEDEYNEITSLYDKNSTRFYIVKVIYEYIIKNKDLYNSNIVFFHHTFDGIRIENIDKLINKIENKFIEK